MPNVEIIGFAPSTYVRVVRMACEEKGVPYDLKPVGPHSAEVAAIHPYGKIPVMRHGDFELAESKAIATYLDRTFPGPKLVPDDARAGALTEQWVSIVNTMMDAPMVRTYLFNYLFPKTADGKPDRAAIEASLSKLNECIGILDKAIGKNGNLACKDFTFADMNLLPILFYVRNFPEGGAAIAAAKNLAAYYDRHAQRPSFKATVPPPPPQQARAAS
jgi:glutathione S-transferase